MGLDAMARAKLAEIAENLRARIEAGNWAGDGLLPNERDLARHMAWRAIH